MSEVAQNPEMLDGITIEVARPDDTAGIAEVQRVTWLDTYPNAEHGITQEDIEEKVARWRTPESLKRLKGSIEQPADGSLRLVAKSGTEVVGHCLVMKQEPHDKLQVLYVLPHYQGRGIGRRLAERGLDWLGKERDIALEVATYNTDSIEFYKKLGFEITGPAQNKVAKLPSGKVLPEYQMVKHAA